MTTVHPSLPNTRQSYLSLWQISIWPRFLPTPLPNSSTSFSLGQILERLQPPSLAGNSLYTNTSVQGAQLDQVNKANCELHKHSGELHSNSRKTQVGARHAGCPYSTWNTQTHNQQEIIASLLPLEKVLLQSLVPPCSLVPNQLRFILHCHSLTFLSSRLTNSPHCVVWSRNERLQPVQKVQCHCKAKISLKWKTALGSEQPKSTKFFTNCFLPMANRMPLWLATNRPASGQKMTAESLTYWPPISCNRMAAIGCHIWVSIGCNLVAEGHQDCKRVGFILKTNSFAQFHHFVFKAAQIQDQEQQRCELRVNSFGVWEHWALLSKEKQVRGSLRLFCGANLDPKTIQPFQVALLVAGLKLGSRGSDGKRMEQNPLLGSDFTALAKIQ